MGFKFYCGAVKFDNLHLDTIIVYHIQMNQANRRFATTKCIWARAIALLRDINTRWAIAGPNRVVSELRILSQGPTQLHVVFHRGKQNYVVGFIVASVEVPKLDDPTVTAHDCILLQARGVDDVLI